MNHVCNYALFRFLPYVETGEFVNIGIVLLDAKKKYFDYKITPNETRITQFFAKLNPDVYRQGLELVTLELERIKSYLATEIFDRNDEMARHLFMSLCQPKESLFWFSEPRTVITDEPAEKLGDLYHLYIEHGCARP